MMTEEQFDTLWQRAEAEGHASRLAAEYPAWRQRQRRTVGMVAVLAIMVAVAVPLLTVQHTPKEFNRVYCNRTGTADAQWAELAAEMLTEL